MVRRRTYGSGQLYVKQSSYYGRWRTLDGRRLNRRVGLVREAGTSDGLTKSEAERAFRKLQEAEDRRLRPTVENARRTVDDAADALRRRLALDGARKSYLNCESMQRVHVSPALGTNPLGQGHRHRHRDARRGDPGQGPVPKDGTQRFQVPERRLRARHRRRLDHPQPRPPGQPPTPPPAPRQQPRPPVPQRRRAGGRDSGDPG